MYRLLLLSAWKAIENNKYLQATQHALACIDGIVDRVQANIAVTANELYFDHHQVVNVVQVFANDVLGMPIVVPLNHQVPAGPHANLVGDVAGKNKLPVVPLDLNLPTKLANVNSGAVTTVAHPLVPDV